MGRAKRIHNWERLTREDNKEAKFLMGMLLDFTECRSCFPKKVDREYITDDEIMKMSAYHVWFEGLTKAPNLPDLKARRKIN